MCAAMIIVPPYIFHGVLIHQNRIKLFHLQ
jgi:hypothetical protein